MTVTNFSEIDVALVGKLRGLVIDGKDVPVVYINPEKEFTPPSLPMIAIYRNGVHPDTSRWTNDTFYSDYVLDGNGTPISVNQREAPSPYNVYYGVRIFYEFQEDGAYLNTHISSVTRRGAFVVIDGDSYDIFFVSYKNPYATLKEFGELRENKPREFVEQYLIRIETELDFGTKENTLISNAPVVFSTGLN